MKSYTNNQLKRKLKNKGIVLDDKKKKLFDKYSYYQVVNAYKNIFSTGIEDIDDIKYNVENNIEIDRYCKSFSIGKYKDNQELFRKILFCICEKYSIFYKKNENTIDLVNKIKSIGYYNHLYSNKVCYSDFVRMYKFEHELRNVLLKYTLIIEESLKNILVTYLNSINAKDNFLTDINEYETSQNNIYAIESIKKIFDKQVNKYSNPIKRKNNQNITIPYWILINELTLGETIKLIINLKQEHTQNILENCIKYFTKLIIKRLDNKYWNYLNTMRELLKIIGMFRNNLAHNQPIYNFNVKEFHSTKSGNIHYLLPKAKSIRDQYILNTTYMSYFANFFDSDKYNSFSGNKNIDLSWIIYVIYKIINHLDSNSNFYQELCYVYQKYNIILQPSKVSVNNLDLYDKLLSYIEIYKKNNIDSLYLENIKENINNILEKNQSNNECNKYNHFQFDNVYTKYTGIDKKYFEKIK